MFKCKLYSNIQVHVLILETFQPWALLLWLFTVCTVVQVHFDRKALYLSVHHCRHYLISHGRYEGRGGSRNFKTGRGVEGARSHRGRILRSKVCSDALSHIPYVFVWRVVNNIHIVNTACWLKSKYLRIYNENLQKRVPYFFKRVGGGTWRAGPGCAFGGYIIRWLASKNGLLDSSQHSLNNITCNYMDK